MNEEIRRLEEKIDGIFQRLTEIQNSQFTELMTEIRKVGEIIYKNEETFGEDVSDDLYEKAKAIVIKEGKASTSYIQRKLKLGYAKSAFIMDMLEENGVIGEANGSKPRDVLVKE